MTLICGAIFVVLWTRDTGPKVGDDPPLRFSNFKPLAAGIARADRMEVFEGLPHQYTQRNLLELEKQSKETTYQHGFYFYRQPLVLSQNDARKLTSLLTDKSSFREKEWSNMKASCGGFHPDFAVKFQSQSELYYVQLCFGCHEMKIFGPKLNLYCKIHNDAYPKIVNLLNPYHKNMVTRFDQTEVPILFENRTP